MRQHRTRMFFQVLNDIKKRLRPGKKLERKECGKIKETGEFLSLTHTK
jgi:hypothetical protein